MRATRRNEYWHIDVTVIRLVTGVKVYLHAVIDNFSRRILAWRLVERLDPTTTCEVLLEVGKEAGCVPTVVADSAVENVNGQVDELVETGVLRRILALVEVTQLDDRSMVAILTPPGLYLHMPDSFNSVKQLIAFYVERHNAVMPHSAFLGQTPDEIYFRTGDRVPSELKATHQAGRQRRLAENRAARCRLCDPADPSSNAAPSRRRNAEIAMSVAFAHAELSSVLAHSCDTNIGDARRSRSCAKQARTRRGSLIAASTRPARTSL